MLLQFHDRIAIAAPLVVSGVLALGGVALAFTKRRKKRRKRTLAQMHMERRRGSHGSTVLTGLWEAAAAILLIVARRDFWQNTFFQVERTVLHSDGPARMLIPAQCSAVSWRQDLIWPSVTRILFQFFSCRELGDAGRYLEVDYAIRCDDNAEYESYLAPTGIAAFLFAFGVPALFWWLVTRYKDHGKAGDKVVHAALSWAYEPYRCGSEWWLVAEMFRILVLTSMIGFISKSCYVKMLMAQIIAVVSLAVFIYARPYRRGLHNALQALTPVRDSLQNTFSDRARCIATATARSLIPAECSAVP